LQDPKGEPRLRLLSGVEVARLDDQTIAWAIGKKVARLDHIAADLVTRLIPWLSGRHDVREILNGLGDADASSVITTVSRLVDAGIVTGEFNLLGDLASAGGPLIAAGATAEGISDLRNVSVAIIGASPPSVALAHELAGYHLGEMVLIDDSGWPRSLTSAIAELAPRTQLRCPTGASTQEGLAAAAKECRVLVHCGSRAPTRLSLIVNRIALEQQKVAVFGWTEGASAIAGPIVYPGETACLVCWRMRELACLADFEAAMSLEEQRSTLDSRLAATIPSLPGVTSQLAGLLAIEIVKTLGVFGTPALLGRVVKLDSVSCRRVEHTVLARADCPACRCGGRSGRVIGSQPSRDSDGLADPAALEEIVVDAETGIVRSLELISKDPFEPERPYVLSAELANHHFRQEPDELVRCSGKGMTMRDAKRSAIGEALERYSACFLPEGSVHMSDRSGLETDSLDPTRLVLFAEHQYESLPYCRWDPNAMIGWTDATDLHSMQTCAVPAMAVYLGYQHSNSSERLFSLTSNGLAAGGSVEAATLAAAVEVIERDAFLTGWLANLPAARIDHTSVHDEALTGICALYARRGVTIELYRLPTDTPVFVIAALGVAQDGHLPAAVLGLGADFDPAVACRKAALEVGQMRPSLRLRLRDSKTRARMADLVAEPSLVADLDDHSLLFADPSMLPAFDSWRQSAESGWDCREEAPPQSVRDRLAALTAAITAAGSQLLMVDLTPADMAALGIFTVRVLLADFQPIHFGANEARLGGTRLYELPHRLGLRDHPLLVDDLCLLPHPLA
jgi:ribosomal protein S12 methylthiotransferase accessory factor